MLFLIDLVIMIAENLEDSRQAIFERLNLNSDLLSSNIIIQGSF
jgi:hypothetical protein